MSTVASPSCRLRIPDGIRSRSRHVGSPASAHVTQSAARVLSGDRRDATILQVVVAASIA
jgi:hypothetical protein